MAKSKVFWLTRDSSDSSDIAAWNFRAYPYKDEDGNWNWNADRKFNGEAFEYIPPHICQMLGIALKPGQKVKARLVLGE